MSWIESPENSQESYSAWLLPMEAHQSLLKTLINKLAVLNDSPKFLPHCTLLSKIIRTEDFSFDKLQTVCSELEPVKLKISDIRGGETLFKSLYIQFLNNKNIADLQHKIVSKFKTWEPYQFKPHLSLMYKILSIKEQNNTITRIDVPNHIYFDSISIMKTGKNIKKWKSVFEERMIN
ncbi:MAG: hypothetical protein CMG69_03760 [Candidatus Marinimicrobia bacterium]|nr:hypothetical protein [Candidatus Neomarinimicrobiota bacterium]|tara:strand:+ start:89442 stop:89975 length:534 start_codon:yes stop_codon:yes gene_type:complete